MRRRNRRRDLDETNPFAKRDRLIHRLGDASLDPRPTDQPVLRAVGIGPDTVRRDVAARIVADRVGARLGDLVEPVRARRRRARAVAGPAVEVVRADIGRDLRGRIVGGGCQLAVPLILPIVAIPPVTRKLQPTETINVTKIQK